MLVYPQLQSGALSQFPVQKRRMLRTVTNRTADGRTIKLPDPGDSVTEWSLEYAALTDDEVAALEQFFVAAEGTLMGFTFLDPTSNLLAWSGQLDQAVWQREPMLSVTGGIADPRGGSSAWRVVNSGLAAQSIAQTLTAPGGYLYCFSAYVRSSQASTVVMRVDGLSATRPIGSEWSRIVCAARGDGSTESIRFGLEIQAGGTFDVYGMQVEPQAGASVYNASSEGGVYQNARLGNDILCITTTGVNRHSCTVNIIHAKHL
jgi:hypothetical protein